MNFDRRMDYETECHFHYTLRFFELLEINPDVSDWAEGRLVATAEIHAHDLRDESAEIQSLFLASQWAHHYPHPVVQEAVDYMPVMVYHPLGKDFLHDQSRIPGPSTSSLARQPPVLSPSSGLLCDVPTTLSYF